ncbi:MAG: nitrite reductase small subunit [Bryobacterales bacterium]|nr:nitrite reductase small subunit [Bryobacterales bacterium]
MTDTAMTDTAMELRVARLDAIPPGEGRTFGVLGEKLAIFRTREGRVLAVQAECPHRGGPLADGLVGGTTVICPLHGWKFDLSTGDAIMGDCGLRKYPVRVDTEGHIFISFEDAAPGAAATSD